MAGRYLYVLGGFAGSDPLGRDPANPVFEYQAFAAATDADVVSLSAFGASAGDSVPSLSAALLLQRLRLGALVAARAARYDAVIASGEDIGVFVALAMRARRGRTPLVIVTHGPQFQSAKFRLLANLVKGAPNVRFACLSTALAELLAQDHGLDPLRCLATGYGVDVDYYHSEVGSTEPIIASAGTSNRDYDTLVRAVTGTGIDTRVAAHSVWVGGSARLGVPLPDHVEVRSYGDYAALRELYRRARAVVVPTHDVPFAAGYAVIAEAMATGTPVIATRGRVPSDFVVDGETGLLVPPGDPQAMRDAIQALLQHPDRAAQMGAAAAARMRKHYSLELYVRRLQEAAAT